MAQTKLENVSLHSLALKPESLTRFFDQLLSHYNQLKNEKAKNKFLRQLLAWNVSKQQEIFKHAHQANHGKAIKLLINTLAFKGLSGAEIAMPAYEKHLEKTYTTLKTPFKTTLYSALKRSIPDVLTNLILSYAMPTQATTLTPAERIQEQAYLKIMGNPVCDSGKASPPETAEMSICRHNLKNELTAAKRKYLLAVFSEFLIGLLWLALKIAILTVLCVGLDFIPIIPAVFITIAVLASFFFSNIRCISALIYPLVSLYQTFSSGSSMPFDRLYNYEKGTAESYANMKQALYGLAVISLMAFTLGVISLLPPLGLAIPVLAWTIAAGLTMTGSITAIGFFHFNNKKERAEGVQFQKDIADFAKPEPVPV